MFVGRPPVNYDRILDFSTAVTGCLFFAPSGDFLDDPPAGPAATATTRPTWTWSWPRSPTYQKPA